ncbi:MAG TPA: hypothetical protein VGM17_00795 [Rhizomicrobium sp.]|jgi:hypothetical protein
MSEADATLLRSEAVAVVRRRGATKGNRNALKHGRYGRQAVAARNASIEDAVLDTSAPPSPLPDSQVQFAKQIARRRGAPKGNRNRLKHGRWSGEFAERRREIDALLCAARNAIVRAEMVVRARKNLQRVKTYKATLPRPRFSGGEGRGEGAVRFAQRLSALCERECPLTLIPLPLKGGEGRAISSFRTARAGPRRGVPP